MSSFKEFDEVPMAVISDLYSLNAGDLVFGRILPEVLTNLLGFVPMLSLLP